MTVDDLLDLWRERGGSLYGGEAVTQLEHALQCAALAAAEQAPDMLIAAALLHDVGHLLHELPDEAPDQGVDDSHERSGSAFLEAMFPREVTEPIRLHVTAKRYLCAVDEGYLGRLSDPSRVSLELQGGLMTAEEVEQFQANHFAPSAVRLRRWDDEAKVPGLSTPPLEEYLEILRSAAR